MVENGNLIRSTRSQFSEILILELLMYIFKNINAYQSLYNYFRLSFALPPTKITVFFIYSEWYKTKSRLQDKATTQTNYQTTEITKSKTYRGICRRRCQLERIERVEYLRIRSSMCSANILRRRLEPPASLLTWKRVRDIDGEWINAVPVWTPGILAVFSISLQLLSMCTQTTALFDHFTMCGLAILAHFFK